MSVEVDGADATDGADVAGKEWEAEASRALGVLSAVFQLKSGTLSVEHHAHRPHQPPQAESPSLPSPPPPTPERTEPPVSAFGAKERKRAFTMPNGSKMWLPNSLQRQPVSNARGPTRTPKQPVGVTPTMLAAAAAAASASASAAKAKR